MACILQEKSCNCNHHSIHHLLYFFKFFNYYYFFEYQELLAACPAGSYMSRLFEKLQDLLPSQRSSDVQFLSHPSLGTARGRVLATARKYQSVNSKSYAPISSPRRDWLSLTVVRSM